MDVKLESKRVCKSVMCAMSNSEDFSVVLTFENSSSIGFRSGEYGAWKEEHQCSYIFDYAITSTTWWMEQLSNTTTE